MKDFLIKLLGGYTKTEFRGTVDKMAESITRRDRRIYELTADIIKYSKNDTPRDPKTGRFVSKR